MTSVLVIDDEPAIVSLLALCLEPLSVELLHATGLAGALELARQQRVGLVLLDLALGDEDGVDLLPRLRGEPGLADVPIVAFSAHHSRRREAIEHGADSFLARPFAWADLRSTVEAHLLPTDDH